MNRRDFAKLSSLALAATRIPTAQARVQLSGQKPIGYAAIGLGSISDIFMTACSKSQHSRITALVTGHLDTKGLKYAAQYGIPRSSIYTYENFDNIKSNKDVDAVYVGLPNSMHKEYTVRAAQAGKHVLCEKPMAISVSESQEMIAACKRAGVKLMIAYRCPFDPTHLECQRLIDSGAIGKVIAFEAGNGFNAPTTPFWRLNKALSGGGSLMDMGIYPLDAIRFFMKEEPTNFTAQISTMDHTTQRFATVEESLTWTMRFPSGTVAAVGTTYGANQPGFMRIHGDKGTLELSPAFDYTNINLHNVGGKTLVNVTSPSDISTHFILEADHFAQCIRNNTESRTPGERGLADMIAIDAIYKAAGQPMAS